MAATMLDWAREREARGLRADGTDEALADAAATISAALGWSRARLIETIVDGFDGAPGARAEAALDGLAGEVSSARTAVALSREAVQRDGMARVLPFPGAEA